MKMKRAMAMTLAAGMALSSAFCGSAAAEETDETYNVVMTIATLGSDPSGLADVEAAINEITEPAIGVTVTLYPIYIYDLSSQINLMLSSGDKLDLVLCTNWTGNMVASLVEKGALLELDDLYDEYGSDIEAAEGIAMAGGYYKGSLYAIPSEEKQARQYGFVARTDIVEELGFSFDADTVYTLDDLEELFAAYKEAYGDGYYCISGTGSSIDFFTYMNLTDYLGASTSSGVLLGGGLDGDTTIVNLYATEEYAEYAQRMYEWAQLGYYSADASTNTDAGATQMQSGYYLGGFVTTETDMQSSTSRDYGYDMTVINLTDKYAATQLYQMTTWSIPANCENPEKTFEFLNLLYADNDLDNILTNGLEGVSYEWVEKGEKEAQGVIRYVDGVDASNSPYTMGIHVFGDKLSIAVYEPLTLDYYTEAEEFNESITEDEQSCTLGYVFNSSSVSTQVAAVNTVIAQYAGIIATGAQNPDTVLDEFNSALEDAGIYEVIEENQRQLDEWLEQNQ